MKFLVKALLVFSLANSIQARVDIWPSIPFIQGANLCQYYDSFSQTRREYMSDMTYYAKELFESGAIGEEVVSLLTLFDSLYDKNQALALHGKYLDVTLESTFKSYLDSYYRDLKPIEKKISFTHLTKLTHIVDVLKTNQRVGYLNDEMAKELDFIAYGTYSPAPNCNGNILVTLHLMGKEGKTYSYTATGKPNYVMSQIASEVFTEFQRTKLPTKIGNLKIVGGLNSPVGTANTPIQAQLACESIDARLPTSNELVLVDMYGDWSGGISINQKVWALANNKVYHPGLMNPSPVRKFSQVNAREVKYYCVK